MQYPIHRFILFFLSILFTTTPTAARPSTPGAPPKSPYPLNDPTRSQTETLTNEDLSYSYAKPPPSITPGIANPLPLPLPLHKRRGGEGDNRRWLPSISPKTSIPLPLPLHKRRGGEGDNRRRLPTSDSSLSATEIENFLTNPGGIVDNAREVLVVHDVSNSRLRRDRRRELASGHETIDPFNDGRSVETIKEEWEDEGVGERSTQRHHPRFFTTPRSARIPVPS